MGGGALPVRVPDRRRGGALEEAAERVAGADRRVPRGGRLRRGRRVPGLLLGWLLTELRRGDDALGTLLALYPLPRPEPEPLSTSGTPAQQATGELAEFYFADVFTFVTDYLAVMIRRPLDGTSATWCPAWWEHPEAGARLSALWLAWEHLRHDAALGMTTWWIQHADPHLKVLMDPRQGPFAACSPEGHAQDPLGPLPVEPYEPT